MFKKGSFERMLELMGKVDDNFNIISESLIARYIMEVDGDDADPEVEDMPSQKAIESANDLEATANNIDAGEENLEKSVITQSNNNLSLSVEVLSYNRRLAEKNVESLKKLAKKLRLPEPVVTYSETYTRKFKRNKTYILDVFTLSVDMQKVFRFSSDYTLAAIVDNQTGGSVETEGSKTVPREYLEKSDKCELCNIERYRGKVFIVIDGKGQYKRLGSSCVKKYLGIDPSKFIAILSFWNEFRSAAEDLIELGDDEDYGGGGSRQFSPANQLVEFPQLVSVIKGFIEKDGYVKRVKNNRGEVLNSFEATYDNVALVFYNGEEDKYPVDVEFANEFAEYLNNLQSRPNGSDFIEKLKQMPSKNIRIADAGLLAPGVNMFLAHKEQSAFGPSEYIGKVGEKVKIPYAKIIDMRSGEGQYGTWYLWTMVDDNGNILKKFGTISNKFKKSGGADDGSLPQKDDVFGFTAEIKSHEEYQGKKTTMLGRLSKL